MLRVGFLPDILLFPLVVECLDAVVPFAGAKLFPLFNTVPVLPLPDLTTAPWTRRPLKDLRLSGTLPFPAATFATAPFPATALYTLGVGFKGHNDLPSRSRLAVPPPQAPVASSTTGTDVSTFVNRLASHRLPSGTPDAIA